MNEPLVSIILPTFNRAHLLKKAVESILKQTYKNFELIVTDDGSGDNTNDVVKSIKKSTQDQRIRYIKLDSHRGGAAARNIAIKASNGTLIASQDDDDEWSPLFLEKQVNAISTLPDEYGMCYVSYWRILPNGKRVRMPPKGVHPKSGDLYGGDIMKKNYCPFQTAVIRREVFNKIGFINESINSLYDWEMWLRIIKTYKVAHIDEPLFTWNFTPLSNSSDPKKIWWRINARKVILDEFGDDILRFGYMQYHISTLADLLIQARQTNKARRYLIKGLHAEPFSIKLWSRLIATLLGSKLYVKLRSLRRNSFLKKYWLT